jgi:hypothetical protein
MPTITLESYCTELRTRFFAAKGVTTYRDIAETLGIQPAILYRFAHGRRVSWENTTAIEAWVIAQEQTRGQQP